nr:hypothetical protein B0A51_02221 [Rachicladosporium sp. CCFEE 5018]
MAYLAPIHRPSSVRHAISLSFLAPDSDDLIVAKANRLEIYSPNPQAPDQLILRHSKTLYGKVTLLHKLRPATSTADHLFVGTDRYHYFTLSWDAEAKDLKTEKSYVDVAEKAARDSQTGDRVHIDPSNRFMTLECYEGVVNVMPIAHAGKGKRRAADNEIGELGDPIPVRIPELFVRSTCFVHKRSPGGTKLPNPELAILEEDPQGKLGIRVRELEFTQSLRPAEEPHTAEFEKSRSVQGQVELGATHLIPLPPPVYGFMVVGETSISYVEEWDYKISQIPLEEATVFVSWCAVDDQRYALADDYGKLYLLYIKQKNEGEYAGHRIDMLGETSRASTLVYLDSGRIFVGSNQGDSQIIQIQPQGLEVLQTFSNIGPILDFTVMDMGNRSANELVNEFSSGQARIVTGSGAFKDGSLRSVRSGVGLQDLGTIGEMGASVAATFALSSTASHGPSDILVISLVDRTRIFKFESDGEVEELETYLGLILDEATLYIGRQLDGGIAQVTSRQARLTTTAGDLASEWRCPEGTTITSVAADGPSVLISLQGAVLVALQLVQSDWHVQAERTLDANEQVSCVTLSPLLPTLCVVGFWQDSRVALLSLSDLSAVAATKVSEDDALAVPRSLCIASIMSGAPPTLFVGLADGNVITYLFESPANPFTARKSIVLGTQQAAFTILPRDDGLQNVLAICEHPSLIYSSEGRMVYSAVTAADATSVCAFDSEAYPGAIAIASTENGALSLATIDSERTTHVETLPVHETVRRIAYSPALKAFGLGTIKRTLSAGVEEVESHFKLVDEVVFEELHTFAFKQDELIECCMRCELDDGTGELAERFVVGTAFLDEEAANAARGRILVFEVMESRQLKLILEQSLKGACRCLAMCQGNIVAALIKTVVVYAFEYQTPSSPFLTKKASYRTATAPIDIAVTGNTIAVSDLMKSVSIVEYTPNRGPVPHSLSEVARHYETLWGTAVANVGKNTYLASDAEGNLVVLEQNVASFSEEEKRRLRVTSEMNLGEMVNRVRPIAVVPSASAAVVPRAFLATVEGSIYLYATIAPSKQDLLMRLQSELAKVVKSPGHVKFSLWRGFKSQVRDMGNEGPMRFVDGELIEAFLDLKSEEQEAVVGGLGIEVPGGAEEVRGLVEGLRRVH